MKQEAHCFRQWVVHWVPSVYKAAFQKVIRKDKKGRIILKHSVKQIVLASGSPRRIQILRDHGVAAEIIRPEVDETLPGDLSMEQAVMYLALKKALHGEALLKAQGKSGLIIAADTVVYKDRIIGKPVDEADAKNILRALCGSHHIVATGVALVETGSVIRKIFLETTKVFFKGYSDKAIDEYIATGEVWDKAGGYAIQGGFAPYVDHIEGDYDNVVGFPWTRIREELAGIGYEIPG